MKVQTRASSMGRGHTVAVGIEYSHTGGGGKFQFSAAISMVDVNGGRRHLVWCYFSMIPHLGSVDMLDHR